MNGKRRQPFTISRTETSRSSASLIDKALSAAFEDPSPPIFRKQTSFLSKQSSLGFYETAFKSHYNIPKTDSALMPELLEKYSHDNLQYRDEDFTQQAEMFITKIAADKKIPKELRAKFPLYQILTTICKIFMLNEYEIVVFACSLDHCNWRIDEVVQLEEADFLNEFPSNFGVEISDECKCFIMYLLIITFSLKQYLNEKTNVERIQAYCEKICTNFEAIYNRWTKVSSFHKFNYSAPEINRKFKHLSKREYGEHSTSIKDYNMIVDNIMTLTGSYSSKSKIDTKIPEVQPSTITQSSHTPTQKHEIFHEQTTLDTKPSSQEPLSAQSVGLSLPRTKTIDFLAESSGLKIPSAFSRQNSISNFFSGFSSLQRQNSFDLLDEFQKKLRKQDTSSTDISSTNSNVVLQPIPRKDTSALKLPDLSALTGLFKSGEADDILNIALPILSKKSSLASQQPPDDLPSFTRYNSTLSFIYDNK